LKRNLRVAEFRSLRSTLVARAQAGRVNTDEDVFEDLRRGEDHTCFFGTHRGSH